MFISYIIYKKENRLELSRMSIETNLTGRLRNTSLPFNHGLLTVFEAVINSIHAIEEAKLKSEIGLIEVEIIRDKSQINLDFDKNEKKKGPDAQANIIGFKIKDNGIGFTEPNMKSFYTLDSDYKSSLGCRGVGRLLWLKAFKKVKIKSFYLNETNILYQRKFSFNSKFGITDEFNTEATEKIDRYTLVHLDGFNEKYREASYKSTKSIANSLFEHCLWYFVRAGGAPKIIIKDEKEIINLEDVYEEHILTSVKSESIDIKDIKFDLIHIKLRAISNQTHKVGFCAANRLVKEEKLTGKIPGLFGKLSDKKGEFIYSCYINSSYLDEHVRSERTEFDIIEKENDLFTQSDLSFDEIRDNIIEKCKKHLESYLIENKLKGKDRIQKFVSEKAPRYRTIVHRVPEEKLAIDPSISDKDLELLLHKYFAEVEEDLLIAGHDIMIPREKENAEDYKIRLHEYLKVAEEVKQSDLASYVTHRKVIIDIFENAIKRSENGDYVHEEIIHDLIIPMRKDSSEIMFDSYNLWLIDERLAFHNFLSSDKSLDSLPITKSKDPKRPDICTLNLFDNPMLISESSNLPLASLIIIEIKRPMRNNAKSGEKDDPIEQALGYLKRIRDGRVTTASGRPIPKSENIPGFCYILCDITPSIEERCKLHDMIVTSDGLGYFNYKSSYNAYVEVISFDRLVNSAKERNRAFFDKLGFPSK